MNQPITGIAQNFSEDDLKRILDTEEVKKHGNHGFAGLKCVHCALTSNVPVSYIWTFQWTCTCGNNNTCNEERGKWQLPWGKPDIGPPKGVLNRILDELGLVGRKY